MTRIVLYKLFANYKHKKDQLKAQGMHSLVLNQIKPKIFPLKSPYTTLKVNYVPLSRERL